MSFSGDPRLWHGLLVGEEIAASIGAIPVEGRSADEVRLSAVAEVERALAAARSGRGPHGEAARTLAELDAVAAAARDAATWLADHSDAGFPLVWPLAQRLGHLSEVVSRGSGTWPLIVLERAVNRKTVADAPGATAARAAARNVGEVASGAGSVEPGAAVDEGGPAADPRAAGAALLAAVAALPRAAMISPRSQGDDATKERVDLLSLTHGQNGRGGARYAAVVFDYSAPGCAFVVRMFGLIPKPILPGGFFAFAVPDLARIARARTAVGEDAVTTFNGAAIAPAVYAALHAVGVPIDDFRPAAAKRKTKRGTK